MNPKHRLLARAAAAAAVALVAAIAAHAGPPLICWKVETNGAASLPWLDDSRTYEGMDPTYRISRLSDDVLALLAPGTPDLARMETIRRAALYAREDSKAEESLLSSLAARAKRDPGGAYAWFDVGYFLEAHRQALGKNKPEFWNRIAASLGFRPSTTDGTGGLTGYDCIVKAIGLEKGDPDMEYAAALVTWYPRRPEHEGHLARAAAGAAAGSLLEKNLLKNFSDRGRTLAELRASASGASGASR